MKPFHYVLVLAIVLSSFISESEAGRRRRTRHAAPSALRGSLAAQKQHNLDADADNLSRFESRDELKRFISKRLLVRISSTGSYYLSKIGGHDPGHSELYRHARPWVRDYLNTELGFAHRKFGHVFKLTSFVRTDPYQKSICRSGNRAATCGGGRWKRSLHLTGAAVDISKEGMSPAVRAWMRKRLIHLQRQGLVNAIEERGAFHVFVRRAYGSASDRQKSPGRITKSKRTRGARR